MTAASTASEIAQPSDPVVPGCAALIARPTFVFIEGDGVTSAPYVRITSRRNGFCSYEHFTMYTWQSSPKNAHAIESAVPHWPAPVSVVTPLRPCAFA